MPWTNHLTCPTENEDMENLENEYVPVKEVQDPILIARNAGASLSGPAKADIARKRKLPVNKGKYKQRAGRVKLLPVRLLGIG